MEFVPATEKDCLFLENSRLSSKAVYLIIANKEAWMSGKVRLQYPPEFLENHNLTNEDLKQVTLVERKQPE